MKAPIGILGGSGLYAMKGLEGWKDVTVETPFGAPSAPLRCGRLGGAAVVFLARHGLGHRFTPTEVPYRANLWALKSLGVEQVVSVSAVGSLQEQHHPGELRLVRQFIDRTKFRKDTFFGEGLVAHVGFAEPTCAACTTLLQEAGRSLALPLEAGATYVCMEGPAFSTRAESLLHRSWGADLIGMTQVTEAKLAREAELCFATIALVTDYDAWRDGEAAVEASSVLEVMQANVQKAQALITAAVPLLAARQRACACADALRTALFNPPDSASPAARERLQLLVARYGY
jgi:5'-methylthioadenosine phosphorylase